MGQGPDKSYDTLEARLGYAFRDRSLLEQALTHKSSQNQENDEPSHSNERLEFLGDAVLGAMVAAHLYAEHSDWSEGDLTKVKAVAVSEATLSRVGRELGLGQYLLLGKGEERSGGRERPSLLANAVEALIGAVFMDSGGGNQGRCAASEFVLRILEDSLRAIEREEHRADYKTMLQEASQEAFKTLPAYRVVDESGPDHVKTFLVEVELDGRVVGTGRGRTKKEAEQCAAAQALENPKSGLPRCDDA